MDSTGLLHSGRRGSCDCHHGNPGPTDHEDRHIGTLTQFKCGLSDRASSTSGNHFPLHIAMSYQIRNGKWLPRIGFEAAASRRPNERPECAVPFKLQGPRSKHDQFAVSSIAHIQLPARTSTLSETIRQRIMRAGYWRFLDANDDKITACGFRNDVRSR